MFKHAVSQQGSLHKLFAVNDFTQPSVMFVIGLYSVLEIEDSFSYLWMDLTATCSAAEGHYFLLVSGVFLYP